MLTAESAKLAIVLTLLHLSLIRPAMCAVVPHMCQCLPFADLVLLSVVNAQPHRTTSESVPPTVSEVSSKARHPAPLVSTRIPPRPQIRAPKSIASEAPEDSTGVRIPPRPQIRVPEPSAPAIPADGRTCDNIPSVNTMIGKLEVAYICANNDSHADQRPRGKTLPRRTVQSATCSPVTYPTCVVL